MGEQSANAERFFIGSDNSGHEYLVPVLRREEFEAWSSLDEDDEFGWETPDYAQRVEGALTFEKPRLD